MALESADFISQLVLTNPDGGDQFSTLDNQDRLIKKAVQQTLPNLNSEVSATPQHLNATISASAHLADLSATLTTQITTLSANLQTEIDANDSKFHGARVVLQANTAIADSSAYVIPFDFEEYDTDSIHDNATNPERVTVPTGYNKIKLGAYVAASSITASGHLQVTLFKNGSSLFPGSGTVFGSRYTPLSIAELNRQLSCTAGDYFHLRVTQTSGSSKTLIGGTAGGSSFWCQIMES